MPQINLSNEELRLMRHGLLTQVDALERAIGISPRTSEVRAWYKDQRRTTDARMTYTAGADEVVGDDVDIDVTESHE